MAVPAHFSCGVYRIVWLGLLLTATVPHSFAATGQPSFGRGFSSESLQTQSARQADEPSEREPPLLHIQQIRSLTPEQAARHIPVKLSGIVTAVPGYKNSFFFQDKTAGISVDRTDHAEVRLGDEVELTGTSGPGLFAPVVLASFVRVIGHGPPPPAPRKTLGDLFGGLQDSQWIELQGVVRSARMKDLFGRPSLLLSLELDGSSVNVQIQDFASIDGNRLIDATIRVRGVCASSGNEKRQFVGSVLLVPEGNDLHVEKAAPKDPFAGAARPVRDILKFGQWQHRVKVVGVVTYQIPGQAIYIQDGEDGIRIQTESREIAVPGTVVEAVGFPAMAEYAPSLESGWFRIVGHGTPVAALPIRAGQVITWRDGSSRAAYDQQLVQVEATLFESPIQGDQRVLNLHQGNVVFEARLPRSALSGPERLIPEGSVLSLTGICTINVGSALNPISFTILLRSPADIVVLKRGPWWTPNRVLILFAGLASLMVLALLWVALLRNRVARQTQMIRESEARFRYLAQHDGLTGLLNRTSILEVLDKQLVLGYRENKTVTVVLGDIDNFKTVNDGHGHLAGDAALVRFAEALSDCVRPYDSVGRYGGEEFLMVLTGIPALEVEDRLHRLHSTISNMRVDYLKTEFRITCSLGAVLIAAGQNTTDRQCALDLADKALYQAKASGRNRVILQQGVGQRDCSSSNTAHKS